MRIKNLIRKSLAFLLACVFSLTCAQNALAADKAEIDAKIMKLMRTEGGVTVSNSVKRDLKLLKNMRLYSGYHVATEESSYAWINLDSEKLLKMDAISEISVRKNRKKLDVLLDSGNLFFNVAKPLEDDELLTIRTSSLAIGIRGTCGWVKILDQWTARVYLLEGVVTVTVTDPVTGETKTGTVSGGETVLCSVYPENETGNNGEKCDILRGTFSEPDIDGFVLTELTPDSPLCDKIYDDSGIDLRDWPDDPEKRLKDDEENVHKMLEDIKKQRPDDPETDYSNYPAASASAPTSTTGGIRPSYRPPVQNPVPDPAPPPTEPEPVDGVVTLTMPQTDVTVENWLTRSDVRQVILLPGNARSSTATLLDVDTGLTVPAGKTLTLDNAVGMNVCEEKTLAVNGTLSGGEYFTVINSGNVVNRGEIFGGVKNAQNAGFVMENGLILSDLGAAVSIANPDKTHFISGVIANPGTGFALAWNAAEPPDLGVISTVIRAKSEKVTGNLADGTAVAPVGYAIDGPDADGWFSLTEYSEPDIPDIPDNPDTPDNPDNPDTPDNPDNPDNPDDPPSPPPVYTVTFNANGGTVSPSCAVTSTDGTLSKLPTPSRSGYRFSGWFTEDGIRVTDSFIFLQSTTIFAHWSYIPATPVSPPATPVTPPVTPVDPPVTPPENLTYTVAFDANGGTVSPVSAVTDSNGKLAALPEPVWNEHRFDGWFSEPDGGDAVTEDTVFDGNTTVYAHWTAFYLNWSYDEATSTLTIDGLGPMPDYGTLDNLAPWHSQVEDIEKIVITGLDSIGDSAFWSCVNVTDIDIPDSIASIGEWAFCGCDSLTSITIPDGVKSIGEWAFYGCKSLTSFTIPDGVTSIRNRTFAICESLTSITIPDSVTSIEEGAFVCCYSLPSIDIPDGITSIEAYTFSGCHNLASITIPDSVTSIGNDAFYDCFNLASITLPDGVTSIGDYTFYNCSSLASIEIPDGVTSIGGAAFGGCSSLTSVTIPDNVTSIGWSAFALCTSLTDIEIPDGVTSIETSTFNSCTSLASITIPDSVTSIGNEAFSGCSSLASISIPNGVTSIGDFAFVRSGLLSIDIPNNVTRIEQGTFGECSSLTDIEIPDGVTSIDSDVFVDCASLTSVTLPDSVIFIGSGAFKNCGSLTDIDIPDGVDSIRTDTFKGCGSLTSIEIPDGVVSIGDNAFSYCKSLTSIVIPNSVTSIGRLAFAVCRNLTSVTLSDSIDSISECTFTFCSALTSVTIPDGVKSIGYQAFAVCGSLSNITIPDSVVNIEGDAFYGCTSLTSIVIPDGVASIKGTTFDGCINLASITIPASVTSIGERAFDMCTALTTVNYAGTAADWAAVEMGAGNESLTSATVCFEFAATALSSQSFAARGVSGRLPVCMRKGKFFEFLKI